MHTVGISFQNSISFFENSIDSDHLANPAVDQTPHMDSHNESIVMNEFTQLDRLHSVNNM